MKSHKFFTPFRITASLALGFALALGSLTGHQMAAQTQPELNLNEVLARGAEVQTLDGKRVKLAQMVGQDKPVLIDFWATWCGPCKIEMPWFVELQKQYGPQGLEIVGVALDDSGKEAISKFAQETGVNYPILLGTDKVGDAYQVQGLPTTYYLGRDGRIVGRTFGLVSHREIEKNIEAALKAAPVSAQGAGR